MMKALFFLITISLIGSAIASNSCSECDLMQKEHKEKFQDCHTEDATGKVPLIHECCPLCSTPPQYTNLIKAFKVYFHLVLLEQTDYFDPYKSLKIKPQIRPPILALHP